MRGSCAFGRSSCVVFARFGALSGHQGWKADRLGCLCAVYSSQAILSIIRLAAGGDEPGRRWRCTTHSREPHSHPRATHLQ